MKWFKFILYILFIIIPVSPIWIFMLVYLYIAENLMEPFYWKFVDFIHKFSVDPRKKKKFQKSIIKKREN